MTELPVSVADLKGPPADSRFELEEVRKITLPHPFCITPRHVGFASDQRSGMLTTEAIESSGAPCGMRGCNLPVSEHETTLTLFVRCLYSKADMPGDLNAIPGLHPYLLSIKEQCTELGIDGFAFPCLS